MFVEQQIMRPSVRHRRPARFRPLLALAVAIIGLIVPPLASAAPKIEHWALANGAQVFFVENHDLPMLAVRVAFDAGSARDPAGRGGLSMLTSGLLNEGSGELDADAVAARFEGLGAEFSTSSDRDLASISLRTLSDRSLREPALELIARLIRDPSFPDSALQRERGRALLALKQADESPGDVATKAFYRQLYGTHPYAAPPEGDEAGLHAITRADLVAFHQRYYVGRNAVLALIGDASRGEAEAIAKQVLGTLPAGETAPPLPKVDNAVRPGNGADRLIPHPSTQTHIVMGEVGMSRTDPDYFPLLVGNYVLGGGGFVSRLTDEIRTQRGLSYSVYSYFYPLREPGPFVVGLQTRNDQRREALSVARRVEAAFVEQGPTADELTAAKKNLTGGFPLRIDSNDKIAEYLTLIGFYHLPLTYLDDFIRNVEAVTADQVRAAFRRHVHPGNQLTVIVGGAKH